MPRLVPGIVHVAEGNGGTTTVEVPVALSAPSTDTVTAHWSTIFGPGIEPPSSATPGQDYTAASGTVTFPPGQTQQTVTVVAQGDTLPEADEYIVIAFTDPVGAALGGFYGLGFGVLDDDDTPPVLIPGLVQVAEGNSGVTRVNIPVTLSKPSGLTVRASWETRFGGNVHPPNPASPGSDFMDDGGIVTFLPGETSKTITVEAWGDTTVEPDEYIVVSFSGPTNATIGGFWGLGFGVLLNDDRDNPRTISVSPSGGHFGGDEVTISGTHWTPSTTIGVCQAVDDTLIAPAQSACFAGGTNLHLLTTDSSGSFSFTTTLERWGYVSGLDQWIDCAASPGCVIGGAEVADIEGTRTSTLRLPWAVLSPPLTRGSITVAPNTGLGDGAAVQVDGTGFRPDQLIDVYQCTIDPIYGSQAGCYEDSRIRLRADGAGSFTTPFTVLSANGGYIVAAEAQDFGRTYALAPIAFAPA